MRRLSPAEIDRILTRIEETRDRHLTCPSATFAERVLDEVGRAVVGKREALTLVLAGVLAKGHVLLEDFPGLGKTLAARSFARRARPGLRPRAVHPRPAARRPDRVVRLRPAPRGVRLPPRPDLHRPAARRRDQPHPAEDPGGAARGDAGAAGHRRGRDPPAARPVPRARHRQPDRVRGHLPAAGGAARPVPAAGRLRLPHGGRGVRRRCAAGSTGSARRSTSSRSPTRPGWPRCRRRSRRSRSTSPSARYCVDLAAATRSHPDVLTGASPRGSLGLVLTARAWAAIRGPRLRRPRGRQGGGPRGAGAPDHRQARALDDPGVRRAGSSTRC